MSEAVKRAKTHAEKAQAIADKAAAEVAIIAAFEPHIPKAKYLFTCRHLAQATACWEVETLAEVVDLMAKLPPIEVLCWKSGCTYRQPMDTPKAIAAYAEWETIEQYETKWWLRVHRFGESRVYSQASVHWYADTPAGRLSCKVELPYQLLARFYANYEHRGSRKRLVSTQVYPLDGVKVAMRATRYYSQGAQNCEYYLEPYDGESFAEVIPAE